MRSTQITPSCDGLVREPGRADQIADRVDAGLAGAQPLVDHDMALLDLHLGALEAEVLDIADDADREHHAVDLERLRLAAVRLDLAGDRAVRRLELGRPWRRSGS